MLFDREYFDALSDGIDQARSEVVFCVYLFKTLENADGYPEKILNSLDAAVKRGISVRGVLELNQESGDLVRANAETAKRLRKAGVKVCPDSRKLVTHTKLFVIDRRYLFIGSHNLTQSALRYNHEASLLLDSPSLAGEALIYMDSVCQGKKR